MRRPILILLLCLPALALAEVMPLLYDHYQWNGHAPYYNNCPMGSTRPCLTGCVATAFSEIMAYWQYPVNGIGTHTYWWDGDQGHGIAACSLSATYTDPYDWANMLKMYSRYSYDSVADINIANPAQKAAVAELCYEIGVAMELDYGQDVTWGDTATWDSVAIKALPSHFGYTNNIRVVNRMGRTRAAWWDTLTTELNLGNPILYKIWHHLEVCDGWRIVGSDSQIHIIYGTTNATYNDWYKVDALRNSLTPDSETVLIGIRPSTLVSVTAPNGGETLAVATNYTIRWNQANYGGNVRIELNRSYPSGLWELLTQSTPNDGEWSWRPSLAAASARIRIMMAAQHFLCDSSDASFSILLGDNKKYVPFDTTLYPTADALITRTNGLRETNYGVKDELMVGKSSDTSMSFLYYPMSFMADCTVVISTGTLNLHTKSGNYWNTSVSAYKNSSDFFEGGENGVVDSAGACWSWRGWSKNSALSVTGAAIDRGHNLWTRPMRSYGPYGTTITTASNLPVALGGLAPLIQSLVDDPTNNYGIVIAQIAPTSGYYSSFNSRESGTPAYRPSLRITGSYVVDLPDYLKSVFFDTVLVADHDTWLCQFTATGYDSTYNYGISDTIVAGTTTGKSLYALFHFNFGWLPHSTDSVVTVTSSLCSLYVGSKYGTSPPVSLYETNHDYFEGTKKAAAADSMSSCWKWAGWSKSDCLSVCGQTIPVAQMAWSNPKIGTTAYDTVTFTTVPMWGVFDNIVPLVQKLIDVGSDSAFGIAVTGSSEKYVWIRSREFTTATLHPRLRVTGYYCVPIPAPLPQLILVAQVEDSCIRLHWTNMGAPAYEIYVASSVSGPYTLMQTATDTFLTVTTVDTAAVQCFYQVRAASE